MKLTAIYREAKFQPLKHVTMEYDFKKDMKTDLKGNGYIVLAVYTEFELELIKQKDFRSIHKHEEDYVQQVL